MPPPPEYYDKGYLWNVDAFAEHFRKHEVAHYLVCLYVFCGGLAIRGVLVSEEQTEELAERHDISGKCLYLPSVYHLVYGLCHDSPDNSHIECMTTFNYFPFADDAQQQLVEMGLYNFKGAEVWTDYEKLFQHAPSAADFDLATSETVMAIKSFPAINMKRRVYSRYTQHYKDIKISYLSVVPARSGGNLCQP